MDNRYTFVTHEVEGLVICFLVLWYDTLFLSDSLIQRSCNTMKSDLFKIVFFSAGIFITKLLLDSFDSPLKNSLTLIDCILLIIITFFLIRIKKLHY